jgi:sulfotransferase
MQKIIFNSSMPRACSTLLQNILAQNPSIHATPTDGALELLYAARGNYTNSPEFKAQDAKVMENAWKMFCKRGLHGYCEGLTDKPIVALKSRGFGIHYNWFEWFLDEQPKVIVMVRNLKGILASMEKIHRANPEKASPMVDHAQMQNTTTGKRVITWLNTQPVGLALERVHQMIQEGIDKKVHFVRAEDLTTNPEKTMQGIYKYLEIPFYQHDFNVVLQTTKEDDDVYGVSNLHTIKHKVEPLQPDWKNILGNDVCQMIDQNITWYQNYFKYSFL